MLNYYQKLQQVFSQSDLKLFWIENAKPDLGIFSANLGSVIQAQKASGKNLNDTFWTDLSTQIQTILKTHNLPFSPSIEKGFVNLKLKSEVIFESFFAPILNSQTINSQSLKSNNPELTNSEPSNISGPNPVAQNLEMSESLSTKSKTKLKNSSDSPKNSELLSGSYALEVASQIPKESGKMMFEYVGTNVAKPMHVGHLVNTTYGESLKRIFQLFYKNIITDCHWGDWGVNFGITLWAWKEISKKQQNGEKIELMIAGKLETINLEDYDKKPVDLLVKVYVWGNQMKGQMLDENGVDQWDDLVRAEFKKLEDEDEQNLALWKNFVESSKVDVKEVLRDFGLPEFDLEQGESYYEPTMRVLIEWLDQEKLWEHEGAGRYFDFEKMSKSWQELEENQSKEYKDNGSQISDNLSDSAESNPVYSKSTYSKNLSQTAKNTKTDFKKIASFGRAYMIQSKDGYTTYCFRDVSARLNWAIEHGCQIMVTVADHTQTHNFEQAYAIACFLSKQKNFDKLVQKLKSLYTQPKV